MSVCLSVDRVVSTLYLQQNLPDPFHIYTSYQATSEGVSCIKFISNSKIWHFGKFYEFVTLTLFLFLLGIQYDSIVWVIMEWQGVSSESSHSSCCHLDSWQETSMEVTFENVFRFCPFVQASVYKPPRWWRSSVVRLSCLRKLCSRKFIWYLTSCWTWSLSAYRSCPFNELMVEIPGISSTYI